MEKIQIQAARIITGTNNYAHKHLLYLETGWEKLSKRREFHRLILLYKILNGLAPQHLCNIFLSYTNFNNGYNLRHNNMQLIYSRTETEIYQTLSPKSQKIQTRSRFIRWCSRSRQMPIPMLCICLDFMRKDAR